MNKLKLDLAQILAAAGVWQDETYPKLLALWQEHGEKCRTCRYPDLHVKAYRIFIEQMFSDAHLDENFKFKKGALSMFAAQAGNLLEQICPEWKKTPGTRRLDSVVQTLALFTPERIVAADMIRELSESERRNARKIFKTLFAVDDDGYPLYGFCIIARSYSVSGQLQNFSIRPMQFDFLS